MASAAYEKIPDVDKAYVLDSIKKDQNRWYLDSISSQKVYFGYTFDDVREKEINLGLDLKGGMNVMLQVQLEDVVQALAENNTDPAYVKAFDTALERSIPTSSPFSRKPGRRMQTDRGSRISSSVWTGRTRQKTRSSNPPMPKSYP